MSVYIARFVFSKSENPMPLWPRVKKYLFRCVYFLFLSAIGAVCDMFFWSFVSTLFF